MSEGVNRSALMDTAFSERSFENILDTAYWNGFGSSRHVRTTTPWGGKQPNRIAMSLPKLSEHLKSSVRQGNIAIIAAFGKSHMDSHAIAVNVAHLNVGSFFDAKAAGVNGSEASSVSKDADRAENLSYFFLA